MVRNVNAGGGKKEEKPLKVLKSRADLKTKDYFQRWGFGDLEERTTTGKGQLGSLGHRKGGGAHSLPSLSQVLNEEDGPTKEQMLNVLRTFAEDYGTVTASIDRIDIQGLDKELQSLSPEDQGGVRTRHRRLRSAGKDVTAGRRWPSTELFERHYRMPHSAQRVLEQSVEREDFKSEFSSFMDGPVQERRRTIARIEDALSPEELAMLPPLEDSSASTPTTTLPSTEEQNQTVRIFEASEVYRQVCEKFGITPCAPMPFFGDTVEIEDPIWGARHCYAVAAAVRMCAPRELILRNNLLTDAGAAKIVEMFFFSPRAEKIHFEGSSLSYKTMTTLYNASTTGNFTVSALCFKGVGLGTNVDLDDLPEESLAYEECISTLFADVGIDRAETPSMMPLLGVATRSMSIRHLDVSNNIFSDEAWACFFPLLRESHLERLYIDNCLLENRSALILAQGLEINNALLELRMRQNALQGPSSWRAIFQALSCHQRISHLDCAENNLTPDIVDSIHAFLKQCQTLSAFHLLEMDRDAGVRKALLVHMGIISPDTEIAVGDQQELVMWRAFHVKDLGTWHACGHAQVQECKGPQDGPSKSQGVDLSLPSGCWICEKRACRWFKWSIPESGAGMIGEGGQLFVLPSFAGFSRVELQRAPATSGKSIVFARDMLVPPGSHFYVFEFGAGSSNAADRQGPSGLQCARDQPSIELETALSKLEEEAQRKARLFFKTRGYTGRVNTLQLSGDGFQIPEGAFDKKDEPLVPLPDKSRKDEAEWKHRLRKCFESDIQNVRMQDLCHANEQPQLEAIIWSRYSSLYEVFAVFAGRSTFPFIRQMDIYDFFEAADIMEKLKFEDDGGEVPTEVPRDPQDPLSRQLTLQDMQQLLMQTMSHGITPVKPTLAHSSSSGPAGSKKQQEMSEKRAQVAQKAQEGRPLARPQFLELILRLAICLYGPLENTMSACLKIFVDKVIVERILKPPLAPFPKSLMWTSEVSSVFIEHTQTLHLAHERFGRNANSFIQLAQLMKLYDKTFTAKNVCSLFALARQPHVDAYETKGTRGLAFAEFCEALVRFSLIRRNQKEQHSIFKDLKDLARGKEDSKGRGFGSLVDSLAPKQESPEKPISTPSIGGDKTALGGLVASKLRDQVRKQMGTDTTAVRHKRFAAHVSRFLDKLKERMKAPKILGA